MVERIKRFGIKFPSMPDPTDPTMLKSPINANAHPPISAVRPRSSRYAGKCTEMKNVWNPHVKYPRIRKTKLRCRRASVTACNIDCWRIELEGAALGLV